VQQGSLSKAIQSFFNDFELSEEAKSVKEIEDILEEKIILIDALNLQISKYRNLTVEELSSDLDLSTTVQDRQITNLKNQLAECMLSKDKQPLVIPDGDSNRASNSKVTEETADDDDNFSVEPSDTEGMDGKNSKRRRSLTNESVKVIKTASGGKTKRDLMRKKA